MLRGLAVFLLTLGAVGVVDGGEETERPWHGILPDRAQTLGTKDEPGSEWYACRFLDADTGRPVAGVRWVRTPESISGWRLRHDAVLSVGVSDVDGIAHVPVDASLWRDDSHWLALAAGYAPSYEYAVVPQTEMRLRRGRPFRGRVLDALGRPLPGATVEAICGCSHGTTPARAKTDAEGRFAFERLDREFVGQLWVEGPGIASDLLAFARLDSLGLEGVIVETGTAHRYEGRIVDLLGEPVGKAVVRGWNEQRGPVTATDLAGRFVLDGVESAHGFQVLPDFDRIDEDAPHYVKDAHPGVFATITTSPKGVVVDAKDAKVVVRARRADGTPAGGCDFLLARIDTGRGPRDTTRAEPPESADDAALGSEVVDVAHGTYRVLPSDPFGELTFDPVEVTVAAGRTATVDVVVRPQPRLRIRGEVPDRADLRLAVAGASIEQRCVEDEWSPSLPATGDAGLRVGLDGRPPFFFAVGPAKDGLREVTVAIPERKVVELPAGADPRALLDGDREAFGRARENTFETDATGPLTVRWKDGQKRLLEATVDVPAEAGARVTVPAGAAQVVVEEVVVRVGDSDEEPATVEPGEMVTFAGTSRRRLRAVAPRSGETVLRWGPATLRLEVVDAEGDPVDALVLAADEVYAAPAGRLELAGFPPGPVLVVVARRGVLGEGRELTVPLGDATSLRRVVLP